MTNKLVLVAFLAAGLGLAQQKAPVSSLQEDCGVVFSFDTASSGAQAAGTTTAGSTGTTAVIDNRQAGCLDWVVTYEPTTATASVTLAFQTATDVAGVPGTWSNYPGTLTAGINPNTAVTTGGARTEASGVQYPFLRMNMTAISGVGAAIRGKLTGWKRRPPINANAVIVPGTVCTAAAPCPVDGPTASGSPVAFPPVMIAGQDQNSGAVGIPLQTDAGYLPVAGAPVALADGESNLVLMPEWSGTPGGGVRNFNMVFNGASWDRLRGTTLGLSILGTKSNNAAAPGATNVGALPAIANAAAPSYTEGFQVASSVNLAGSQRTVLDAETTKVIGTVRNLGNAGAAFDAAMGAAPPANGLQVAGLGSGATGGLQTAFPVADGFYNINISTATTTLAITGVAGRHIRISHINMVAAGAQNVAIISGTGGTCGTGTAAIVGTSTATGYQWTAQTGISAGNGLGTIMRTVAAGDSICIITDSTAQLSGVIAYTIY